MKMETFGNKYFQKVPSRGKNYKYLKKYIRKWKMFEINSNKVYNLNMKN